MAIVESLSLLFRYPLNTPPSDTKNIDGATKAIDNEALLFPTALANAGAHIIFNKVASAPILANIASAHFRTSLSSSTPLPSDFRVAITSIKDFGTPAVHNI